MSSMIFARPSSSGRTAVTLGAGMELSTWLSMSSAQMLRTCGVSELLGRAVDTMGFTRREP